MDDEQQLANLAGYLADAYGEIPGVDVVEWLRGEVAAVRRAAMPTAAATQAIERRYLELQQSALGHAPR